MDAIDEALRIVQSVSPSNSAFLQDLKDRVCAPHAIPLLPFIGAGLSMPMGFPSWSRFLLDLSADCGREDDISTLLDTGQFEDAAELIENELGGEFFNQRIAHTFGARPSRDCSLHGAVTVIPELGQGAIATTNFDRVLERVFSMAGLPFDSVIWPSQVDSMRRAAADNQRYLIKLHGDAEERTGRVLTKSEYDATYSSTDPDGVRAQMSRLFQGRTLLFLGCSLGNDRTMEVLAQCLGRMSGTLHFAIIERPRSDAQFLEKQKYLSERGILPIWYPTGHHDLLEPILRWLVRREERERSLEETEAFLVAVRDLRKRGLIDQEAALKAQGEALNRFWLTGFGGSR